MDDKLIKKLQETVLFEEDLFPSAPKEEVLNRKITGLKQRHEQEIERLRKRSEEEQHELQDTEQKRQELASKIEEVRAETQRRNQAWVEKRKRLGIVGDEKTFKLPNQWVTDIKNIVYTQNPDFNNLSVEVTSEVITFTKEGLRITLACDVPDVFVLPYREVSFDSSYKVRELESQSVKRFVDTECIFEEVKEFRVYFQGHLTYSTLGRSKIIEVSLYYFPFTRAYRVYDMSEDYEEVKRKVTNGPMKREQIRTFAAIRKAAVERDYQAVRDLVTKLSQYYGQ